MNISPPGSEKKARIYYFDTLRAFLILLVLIIHSANMLVPSYNMGVGGNSPYLQYCIDFLPQWIIALFFLFAGAGTRFALRRRTAGQFIGERCRRLLIPLIGGFLLIAPLQAYFEALGQPGQPTNFLAFSASFLTHIPFSWNPQWMGAYLHHLWFLADLFLISLLLLPLCRFFQSDSGSKLLDKLTSFCEGHKGLAAFWLFLVPLALVQLGLRPAFPGYQNWADVFTWLLCYIYGYVLFATPRFAPSLPGLAKER
ncbi:hypothetical protein EPA93_28655 [Ktedonosporobacter rubrisoli]|uniref:Acyltransferase 3 domain-containing protein n=1 Tax=Ktedonosporobacter rubrisoli TaxID=2509675 RepID=A0A4P6JW82_KTERU|nr:acyltransferase family protein [Ktedonosporobacter rubrisoli]QBD79735.1 hypothetical protein EPA93_28655 [Ktedonosporobacter rubrisoli]